MAKTTTQKTVTKKTAKAVEVKTVAQLQDELRTLHQEQLESRKSHKQGELVNPHVLTVQRKNIARLHTALTIATVSENLSTKVEEK